MGGLLLAAFALAACDDPSEPVRPNPVPVLLRVAPSMVTFGGADTAIELRGQHFVRGSRARLGDEDRITTFVNDSTLQVRIDSADRARPLILTFHVVSPPPGGGESGVARLTVGFPAPVIAAIAPGTVDAGGPSIRLAITGSGISEYTGVRFGSQFLFRDSVQVGRIVVQVPAELLTTGGNIPVSLVNPSPGGGTSAPMMLAVRNPVPAIASLTPDTALTGAPFTLTVHGTSFTRSSVVRWNGAERPTTYVSGTRLTAAIPSADVAVATTASITVANPEPGGGVSGAMSLRVREAPPRIVSLSPSAVTAGSPAFTLTVGGSGFSTSSVVHWDGAARATQFVNASTLTIAVPAADVAAPGSPQVTVVNPGSSGSSAPVTLPVLAASAGLASERLVELRTNHVVWDATRSRLYVTVPSTVTTYGNRVVAIDPATGAIDWSVAVGSEPGRMAISDDAQFLYVILNGAPVVVRVTLADRTKTGEYPLGSSFLGSAYGEDIEVLPGQPNLVAVSRRNSCCSPRHEGVVLLDNGVIRTQATQGHTGSNRITRSGSAARLFGYNNETTEFGFRRIAVTGAGLGEEIVRGGLIDGFGVDIEYDGGRVYASNGAVVDPETMARIGTMGATGLVRPDARNGRVHFLSSGTLRTMHATSFGTIGTASIPSASGATSIVRWGTDGLAFAGGAQLVIVRGSLIGN